MPVDFVDALRELDAQIAALESDLETLRASRPAFVVMRNKQSPPVSPWGTSAVNGMYSGMGNQAAVRKLMADGQMRTRDEIYQQLTNGGFTSDAVNPVGSLGAALSQMKDELERIEDRWRKRTSPSSEEIAEYGLNAVSVSNPSPNSLTRMFPAGPLTSA